MSKRLEIYRPISPWYVSQYFGEAKACIDANNKVVGKIGGICPQGYEDLYQKWGLAGHTGLDIPAQRWQPIYSATDGIVEELETEPERGLGIGIISDEKFAFHNGEYFAKVRYWHLAAMNVVRGQKVGVGQLIGWIDNTGYSGGDHLHFELKPVLQDTSGRWYNIEQDNGFYGAIDPNPYVMIQSAYSLRTAFEKLKAQLSELMNRLQDFLNRR